MVSIRVRVSAGQITLLRFLAHDGAPPKAVLPATMRALVDRGLALRDDDDRGRYKPTKLGRAVVAALRCEIAEDAEDAEDAT